jgi:diguanylate cyclase
MAELNQPSEIAREVLLRMRAQRLQPTPDNYRNLYHEISGTAAAEEFPDRALRSIVTAMPRETGEQERFAHRLEAALADRDWNALKSVLIGAVPGRKAGEQSWGSLIRGLIGELERRHADFTPAKKHEALEHVLTAWGKDSGQLYEHLQSLTRTWSLGPQGADQRLSDHVPALEPAVAGDSSRETRLAKTGGPLGGRASFEIRDLTALILENGLAVLLVDAPDLAKEATQLAADVRRAANPPALETLTGRMKQLVYRMQWAAEDQTELKSGLLHLLRLILDNVSDLVIDEQWLRGQVTLLNDLLSQPLNVRRLGDVESRLKDLIFKQSNLKKSLNEARDRLKMLLARFIDRLADFTESTSEYHNKIERCAERISAVTDVGQLSDVVDEVMSETRQIQTSALRSRDELREVRARVEDAEREVARLQEELAQASEMVRQDQLTGVLNRKGLNDALEREAARGSRRGAPPCVALLDVDNFKLLNDTYSHQTGDDALVHLVRVLRETLRPQDTVARYGGEEFVVVLPDTELEESVAVLTRLQRELTRRFFLHDNVRTLITFSAGVTRMTPGESPEQALARADAAMYEAKRAGKNRVVAGS